MTRNIVHLFVCSLGLLASVAQGNSLFEKRETLERRDCPAGSTTCSVSGLIRYCAQPGWKCCDATHSAPQEATCCPGGYYALTGSYCCAEGGSCRDGRTCRGCTPVNGNPGSVGPPVPTVVAPSITAAPTVAVPTVVVTYTYYTFTLTYYYWQYYYIYVPSLTRSTATSSTVTTRTLVTVYASNSAAAQSSFSQISATAVLPTPASATALPPLPSQTADLPSVASTRTLGASSTASPAPSQFVGAASGVWVQGSLVVSLSAWVGVFVVGALGVGVNFLL